MSNVTHTFGSSRITHPVPMRGCEVCNADLRVDAAYRQGRKAAAEAVMSLLLALTRSAPMHSFVLDRQGVEDIYSVARGGEQA